MATLFKIKIPKADKSIEVDFDEFPDAVKLAIVEKGLSALLVAATAKVTIATDPDPKQRADNAMALVNKKLDAMKDGKLRVAKAKDSKVPAAVRTEAMRLAKNIVKAGIKADGKKISDYAAKAITEAAEAYLEEHQELIAAAEASINAAKELAAAAAVNVSAIKADPALIAKREKANAEKRAATAEKNAGKPGPQKSAIKQQAKPVPAKPGKPQQVHA